MPDTTPANRPEIMSPAGHWPELRAAMEAGADAVYFGLTRFSARAKVGFVLDELPEVMAALHERGVRGYVTFNTLIFDEELRDAADDLAAIAAAGADAIIVQDPAVARLARRIAPDLALHGSTQMSITGADGVELALGWGISRVVLARELSLKQVRSLRARTDCELEMFVHGALCVSYSGQCFSSEAWGGRSANRGQCAQACRLPYELFVDDRLEPLGDARYLLSPGDLAALDHIPEIVDIGISALKIEGRYKGPAYVALTTRAYRQAVDDAIASRPLQIQPVDRLRLEQVYSRGLGPHFVSGTNHQAVVVGRAPRHRGVRVGRVAAVQAHRVLVTPDPACDLAPLKPGDGLVFDAAHRRSIEAGEEGGRLYRIEEAAEGVWLTFGRGHVDPRRVAVEDWVWRTHDPDVDRAARPFTDAAQPLARLAVDVRVRARVGEACAVTWTVHARGQTLSVDTRTTEPLPPARQHAVDDDYLRQQLGRLGGTAFELGDVTLDVAGTPFAPASMLAPLRHQAVAGLTARLRQLEPTAGEDPAAVVAEFLAASATRPGAARDTGPLAVPGDADLSAAVATGGDARGSTARPALHLLVRTPEQLEAALACRPDSITLDYLDLYGLRPAVDAVRAAGLAVRVATPRVLKPGEEGVANFLRKLDCSLLVRSSGWLQILRPQTDDDEARAAAPALVGDFSLNAANAISADTLLRLGLDRITPTHDLNAEQISALARHIGGHRFEVVAFHHLPVFHTEHCVFCRFLSSGTSIRDCGKPCNQHRVALRDPAGRLHPVLADVGCRNTVFGAEAQEASRHLRAWLDAGIGHWRVEFTHETAAQVDAVSRAFARALRGQLSPRDLAARLRAAVPAGTTEGSLFVPDETWVPQPTE